MDRDRADGIGKQVGGWIKEAVGKMTGDTKTQVQGKAEQTEGKVQNTMGGAKDKVRDAFND